PLSAHLSTLFPYTTLFRSDCAVGEDAFRRLNEPVLVEGQRASGLRFADVAVQALLGALLVFRLLPRGFSNRDLRDHWAPLLGKRSEEHTSELQSRGHLVCR